MIPRFANSRLELHLKTSLILAPTVVNDSGVYLPVSKHSSLVVLSSVDDCGSHRLLRRKVSGPGAPNLPTHLQARPEALQKSSHSPSPENPLTLIDALSYAACWTSNRIQANASHRISLLDLL